MKRSREQIQEILDRVILNYQKEFGESPSAELLLSWAEKAYKEQQEYFLMKSLGHLVGNDAALLCQMLTNPKPVEVKLGRSPKAKA